MAKDGRTRQPVTVSLPPDPAAAGSWVDLTDLAKRYLRSQALTMAHNLATNGRPREHALALQGLHVLDEEQSSGVTVIVGGGGTVNIGIAASSAPLAIRAEVSEVSEKLPDGVLRSHV